MKKTTKNLCSILLILILTGCQIDPNLSGKPNELGTGQSNTNTFTGKISVNKLKGIVVTDKIILNKPDAINSDKIQKEISELNSQKLNSDQQNKISYWSNSVVKWNEIARELVIKYKTTPPEASRVYSLLSVGQYDALVNAYQNKYLYNRNFRTSSIPSYPSDNASIAEVSSNILTYLYPLESEFLLKKANENKETRFWGKENLRSDLVAGSEIGKMVSDKIIDKAKFDNSDKAENLIELLTNEGSWKSLKSPSDKGLLPSWGKVKPWTVEAIESLPVIPPPVYNSDEFKNSVSELVKITNNLTDEQKNIARYWSDGNGTSTPPGHWNLITSDLIDKNKFDNLKSAQIMAFLNISMMDASICCWSVKYKYQVLRPTQASKEIKNLLEVPNFPSYTSGHSSFSGAAATVLSNFFPQEKDNLNKMAEEAAISRLYAGIHYNFDSEQGLKNGQNIGNLAIAMMNKI